MKSQGARDTDLTIEYDLFSLPTAQHKAGLAGMLLMIETLKDRDKGPVPVVEELSASGARIVFTKDSLQIVFDDLYDAEWIEREQKKQLVGKEPKAVKEKEVQINGKKKVLTTFVYDVVQPKGAFLQNLYPGGDMPWVKLWRDMIGTILRGPKPASRAVYKNRAENNPCPIASKLWASLNKSMNPRKKTETRTENISSSIFLGAEQFNAERVPFQGEIEHNLLLHFWTIVSFIYIPHILSFERSAEQELRIKHADGGYVLAVPEPSNLKEFCSDVRRLLHKLTTDTVGFRPKSALIDLYEEGGLEYLYQFAKDKVDPTEELALSLGAVELYHLQKQGDGIRQLAAKRILPNRNMLKDYENLRKAATNPYFKSLRIRNLLNGRPWYEGADRIFHQMPMPLFVFCRSRTPMEIRFFGIDVRRQFANIEYGLNMSKQGGVMGEKEYEDKLTLSVYHLIKTYVNQRTKEKSDKTFKDFLNNKEDKEYREAREKVCTDAFLAMRGRRDQNFIEYFTGTICSVPQYMSEGDYVAIASALMTDWDKIKTLSMLALSAHSYLSQPKEQEEVE